MNSSFVENGFIIDLSNAKNTAQLVFELSSIMEHPDVKGKRICLKLGDLDLKQSQLLSIKALIESMEATIAFINTSSEQTEVSAKSLGMVLSDADNDSEIASYVAEEHRDVEVPETVPEIEDVREEVKTVEIHPEDEYIPQETISTVEGVEDTYTEQSARELKEVIPAEHFANDFERLAESEGLYSHEEASKYILLDTGDVLEQGAEENSTDTKTLPTLYLSQTLRSGQTVNYEGNIFIVGDAHPGSEIIAGGDITIWGILGGIAHAGSNGNISSKVRALKLNAIQLRIAGLYARRNDTLNVPYVQKTDEFTPEEAQIEDGRIVIYKKLRRD